MIGNEWAERQAEFLKLSLRCEYVSPVLLKCRPSCTSSPFRNRGCSITMPALLTEGLYQPTQSGTYRYGRRSCCVWEHQCCPFQSACAPDASSVWTGRGDLVLYLNSSWMMCDHSLNATLHIIWGALMILCITHMLWRGIVSAASEACTHC